jgi:pyrroline-5-carboxylate reductase
VTARQTAEIAFVGGGNMARALIAGLIAAGHPPECLGAVEPDAARRAALGSDLGVRTAATATALVAQADTVVLAVKPQVLKSVATGLAPLLRRPAPLVVSIAAGVRLAALRAWLGPQPPLVRCMPNTPALVGAGVTALYAPPTVAPALRARAQQVLAAVGETLWVDDEDALDAVTAVSGSGPAYFFALMEALEAVGTDLGLSAEVSRTLAVHTARGAGLLAAQGDAGPAALRAQVTSPGGTTEAALRVLASGGFEALLGRAVHAAAARSRELSGQTEGT